jgi:hypothetical protein
VVEEDDKRGVVILENDEWRVRVPEFDGLPTWDKKGIKNPLPNS